MDTSSCQEIDIYSTIKCSDVFDQPLPQIWNQITSISISNSSITHFPKALLSFPNLQNISFSSFTLNKIPEEISNLTKLRKLEFSLVNLGSISPRTIQTLESLPNLVSFSVKYQFHISPIILRNVESISFVSTDLSSFPNFSECRNLFHLNLTNNGFQHIPISKLPISLSSLNLQSNNFFEPFCILNLTLLPNLVHLNLSECSLWDLPQEISNLSNIQTLNISSNNLKKLPVDIGKMVHLRLLDAHANFIGPKLPNSLARCTKLVYLNFQNNFLSNLSNLELNSFLSVEYLNFSSNELSLNLPSMSLLTKLRTLVCSSLYLKNFPVLPKYPNQLKVLRLDNNQISKIPNESVFPMQNLTFLDISSNLISSFPKSFISLQKLEKIDISLNSISKFPFGPFPKLKSFDVSRNKLKTIPKALIESPFLENVNLSSNRLSSLPMCSKSRYSKLVIFDISNNLFHKLPSQVFPLLNSRNFFIQGNPLSKIRPSKRLSSSKRYRSVVSHLKKQK